MQKDFSTLYLEVRASRQTTNDGLAAELAKHLHARQHVGSAVIVTDAPIKLIAVVRKQWFKLARSLQRERAGTVNAQKILHLTYAVTRMHALAFVPKTPEQRPEADVFFILPTQLQTVPFRCYSLYLAAPVAQNTLKKYLAHMPPASLIVDYADTIGELAGQLKPKVSLTEQVRTEWQRVLTFLQEVDINIVELSQRSALHPSVLDDAIDLLLDYSAEFLRVAGSFQHHLQLAQPLEPNHETQREYNTLTLLAHRVQTLSTGQLSDYLDSVVIDNSFFLRDAGAPSLRQQLATAFAYHAEAGHERICEQLESMASRGARFSEVAVFAAL